MATAAPNAFSVRNCVASATVSLADSDTGPGVMISAAVLASRVSFGIQQLRGRGFVKSAPGTAAVKQDESLLLDFRREIPESEARRVLAIRLEDGEDRLGGVEGHC